MIELDPQRRNAILGFLGAIAGAGWVAYAVLGDGNRVFLTVMLVLSILVGASAAFVLRVRRPQ